MNRITIEKNIGRINDAYQEVNNFCDDDKTWLETAIKIDNLLKHIKADLQRELNKKK